MPIIGIAILIQSLFLIEIINMISSSNRAIANAITPKRYIVLRFIVDLSSRAPPKNRTWKAKIRSLCWAFQPVGRIPINIRAVDADT